MFLFYKTKVDTWASTIIGTQIATENDQHDILFWFTKTPGVVSIESVVRYKL